MRDTVVVMALGCAAVVAALLMGCGAPTITGEDGTRQQEQSVVGSATSPAAPAPSATPQPASGTAAEFEVAFGPMAGFVVRNLNKAAQELEAYTTDFDNQARRLREKSARVEPNGEWRDSFDTGCVQLDIAYGGGGKIIAFAYFDKGGKQFGPGTSPEKITECRVKPTPTPSPTPSPTPTPKPSPSCTPKPKH